MTPKRLLEYFNEIAEAPDAVPRLRRFILDLAVRGKLVEQDPNDEPAVELLKRIGQIKERLIKEGIRKEKLLPPMKEEPFPFQIPRVWQWSRLAEVGFVNPRNSADDELQASFVPMPLISAEYGVPNSHEGRPWGEIKNGYTHFADGDVALAKITPCFENGKSAVFRGLTGGIGAGTTELHVLRPVIINPDYALVFLKCPHFIENGITRMTGTAGQKRVPTEYFACSPFPLPPLAEQHRIVAKANELMTLCDELEEAQQKRERRRDRLVTATLNGIGRDEFGKDGIGRDGSPSRPIFGRDRSPNGPVLRGGAFGETVLPKFFLNHLPRLTTRPAHIQQLRQTILNLAVQGKLVPQDPNDEPASELLKRIDVWRSAGVAEKRVRLPRKPLLKIAESESPYSLPAGWNWARLGQIIYIHSGDGLTAEAMNGGTIPVFGGNGINGFHDTANVFRPTVVIGRVGYYCGSIHITPSEAWVTDNAFITEFCSDAIFQRFLVLLLKATNLKENEDATAQPVISGSKIYPIVVGLPPLAEQHRIVAKAEELLALCDSLEGQLNTVQTESRRLCEAICKQALSPVATE